MRKLMYFDTSTEVVLSRNHKSLEFFSAASDLKVAKLTTKQQYVWIVKDYSNYANAKKATITTEDLDTLDQQFVAKFNGLIAPCEELILNGGDLSLILGISDKVLKTVATAFGRQYRKLLQVRDSMGYIPKEIQLKVDKAYKLLIAEQRKLVFKPVLNLFSDYDEEALSKDDTVDESTKAVLINGNPDLNGLRELIVGTFRDENIEPDTELLNKITTNVHNYYTLD